uniref:Gamma-glutamyltransferase n=1 Tax=Anopheles epiroticus TaxID=199890 RepID=A0A182PV45_9DIPT
MAITVPSETLSAAAIILSDHASQQFLHMKRRNFRSHTSLLGSYFLRAASCARISAAVIGRFSFLPSVADDLIGSGAVPFGVTMLLVLFGVAMLLVPFSAIFPTAAPSVTVSTFFVSSMIFSIIFGVVSGVPIFMMAVGCGAISSGVVVVGRPVRHGTGSCLGQRQLQIVRIGPRIDHQQTRLVRDGLDQLDHLFVRLGRDVLTVHLDDTIALAQAGRLCRRTVVHLADVLTRATLFRVQIKPVPVKVGPLHDVTKPGFGDTKALENRRQADTHWNGMEQTVTQLHTRTSRSVLAGRHFLAALLLYLLCRTTSSLEKEASAGSALASNVPECANVGMAMLDQGGSAVDAAIATLFCEGVSQPHAMGIGGGFVMTIYSKQSGLVECLNAREVAPAAATSKMFVDREELSSVEGGLAIAVPGEVKGYWEVHQRYGKLPWKVLVQPAIEICQQGLLVTEQLEQNWAIQKKSILKYRAIADVFINPATNDTWKRGDLIRQAALGESLRVIAVEGADALYSSKGTLLPKLLQDLRDVGSIITEDDFYNYRPDWVKPAEVNLRNNYTVYSTPLPASGEILNFILSILDGYEDLDEHDPLTWHRIVESFKHGYGKRSKAGDPRFLDQSDLFNKLTSKESIANVRKLILKNMTNDSYVYYGATSGRPEDHGTAHISVLAGNGDAVAVTSSINYLFGSLILSPSTGIILNDQMDDFSTPGKVNTYGLLPSPSNYIVAGKRPLSSMSPTIILDHQGDVRMVVGAAGGSRITTATAQLILRHLFFGQSLCEAMDAPRLHHHWVKVEAKKAC